MRFRTKILLPFAIVALVVFAIGRINSPIVYLDKSFLEGKELQQEVLEFRNELLILAEKDAIVAGGFEVRFEKINSKIDLIVDEGRERFYSYPRWISDSVAFAVLLLGLIITIFVSWRADVSRLNDQTAEQGVDPNA